MGVFVLGVLIGWLVEWLFYTFWVKAGEEDSDCSSIKAELELKNKQISSLQTQLASAYENTSTSSNSTTKASENTATNAAIDAGADSGKGTKPPSVKAASTKSEVTPSDKSVARNKTATSKKSAPIKKSKSSMVSNTNKATNGSAKSTTTSKQKKSIKGDDFTKLSGIGPSMSATLKSIGIDTFEKLASTDDDFLRKKLDESGARMNNNKEAMDTWNEQATVAAKGDFKALKVMQSTLKK